MEELVTLPGVGRKTANLVLILGFKSGQNICVDTHVHRISNRLGLGPDTPEPEETEQALYRSTASRWWPFINLYLVTWGQNVCRPVYPRCGDCVICVGLSKNWPIEMRRKRVMRSLRVCCSMALRETGRLRRAGTKPAPGAKPAPTTPAPAAAPRRSPGAGPVIVFETIKGTFRDRDVSERSAEDRRAHPRARQAQLLQRPARSPLRAGFVVQWGDPQTRDMTKRDLLGHGRAAAKPIGVSEVSPKRPHVRGAVGAA